MNDHKVCGERGFTLIELLVVVIIIGILAAIAIPTFIAHRDRAAEVTIRSDLRNGGTSAVACAADNDGSFVGCEEDNLMDNYGWNQSEGSQIEVLTADEDQWIAEGFNEMDSDQTVLTFDTESSFE